MSVFGTGEQVWIDRFDTLRNVVRQELISRQLASSVAGTGSVLDVGCGQGTQSLHLLAAGWNVTGIDPSTKLLDSFRRAVREVESDAELIVDTIEELDGPLGDQTFDLVCAHGLLMYLDDRAAAVKALATRVADKGLLSITFRNAHGLAMRAGVRQEWESALRAFDSTSYVNELGLDASADRLDAIESHLSQAGLEIFDWFGVRVFTDGLPPETPVPGHAELVQMLDAEELAGSRDPYR